MCLCNQVAKTYSYLCTMKKTGATFSLWLASLALIAATILPHHHHSADICFATEECGTAETGSYEAAQGMTQNAAQLLPTGETADDCGCPLVHLRHSISVGKRTVRQLATPSCAQFPLAAIFSPRLQLTVPELLANKSLAPQFFIYSSIHPSAHHRRGPPCIG